MLAHSGAARRANPCGPAVGPGTVEVGVVDGRAVALVEGSGVAETSTVEVDDATGVAEGVLSAVLWTWSVG
jgi:hypothetical protein